MLLEITGERLELRASLGEIVISAQHALREVGDAIGVRGGACGNALEFYSAGVGAASLLHESGHPAHSRD